MDFKHRYPNFNAFPSDVFHRVRVPFLFDYPGPFIREIDLPSGGPNVFLQLGSFLSSDESTATCYLTESTPGCSMRRAFEFGEITWSDFWLSRPWLLRLVQPFPGFDPSIPAQFILPHEMCIQAIQHLKAHDLINPLRARQLDLEKGLRIMRVYDPSRVQALQKLYDDFMAQYGDYLKTKAA